jgi:hypothetical protein
MPTSIAEYYINELNDWEDAIALHTEVIEELEEWLKEVLRNNTVVNLAGKVEHYLNNLFLTKQNLGMLKTKILEGEEKLYTGEIPISNEQITEEIKSQQNEFRKNLYSLERQYLDIKFECEDFLAATVTKQNKKENDSLR